MFFRFDLLICNRLAHSDSPIVAISTLANSSKFELRFSSSSKCEFNAVIAEAISSDKRGDNFWHLMPRIFVRLLREIPMHYLLSSEFTNRSHQFVEQRRREIRISAIFDFGIFDPCRGRIALPSDLLPCRYN
jgi:hypothetical protein